jgi:hypothetical protein
MARWIINLAYLMGALCVAWILEAVGRVGWDVALVNDRVWGVPFGWVSWPHLISWLFLLLLFFALGVVITWFVRSKRVLCWAAAPGAIFSVVQFVLSHHLFGEHAGLVGYVWMYGQYLMPPIGSLAGGWLALRLSGRRSAEGLAAAPLASR